MLNQLIHVTRCGRYLYTLPAPSERMAGGSVLTHNWITGRFPVYLRGSLSVLLLALYDFALNNDMKWTRSEGGGQRRSVCPVWLSITQCAASKARRFLKFQRCLVLSIPRPTLDIPHEFELLYARWNRDVASPPQPWRRVFIPICNSLSTAYCCLASHSHTNRSTNVSFAKTLVWYFRTLGSK